MDRWLTKANIKQLTLGASLVPALVMFLILTPHYLYERTKDIEQSLEKHGKLLTTQLANMSEYALVSGNTTYLVDTLDQLLQQPEIYSITISDLKQQTVVEKINHSVIPQDIIVFNRTVTQTLEPYTLEIIEGLSFNRDESVDQEKPEQKIIGNVRLQISKHTLYTRQKEIVIYGVVLALVALLLAGLIGRKIGNSITQPIRMIVSGVKRLRQGNYRSPIGRFNHNELGSLAVDIDTLAAELDKTKKDIENTIHELTKARDQADRANASKSDFLALISHEIRSPLNSAFGVIQLLEETTLNSPQRRYIELALNSFNHLMSLLDDIIDFSTLDYGEIKIEKQATNVKQIVQQVVSNYTIQAQQKSLALSVHYSGNINLQEIQIYSDPTRLRQILNNLVDNAIKFTVQGNIHLQVNWMSNNEGENIVLNISVQDTGIGIEQDKLQSIFKMFTQSAPPSTRGYGGVGLGLYIVKRLSKLLGGYISVRSQVGIGSIFNFELPVKAVNQTEVAEEQFSYKVTDPDRQSRTGRVLVVEDDAINREVINGFLTQVGINVDLACNGIEALNLFKENMYDLAFIDCFMPNMDGFELARSMRQFETSHSKIRTPLIAITASALPATKRKCMEAGMDDLITKPYRKFELYKRISAIYKTSKILDVIMQTSSST